MQRMPGLRFGRGSLKAMLAFTGTLSVMCLLGAPPAGAIPDRQGSKATATHADRLATGVSHLVAIHADLEDNLWRGDLDLEKRGRLSAGDSQDRVPPTVPSPRAPKNSPAAPIPEPAATLLFALGSVIIGRALRHEP